MRRSTTIARPLMFLAVCGALLLAACTGGSKEPAPTPAPSPTAETPAATETPGVPPVTADWPAVTVLKSEAVRATADAEAMAGAATALDKFASDLYGVLAREDGNLVLSPYSIMVALAMARAGAGGETLQQMSDVLHAGEADDLDAGLNAIDQELATRSGEQKWDSGSKTGNLELVPANQIWSQYDFAFHGDYLDRLASQYGAGVRLVDYVNETEQARQAINSWGSDQTHGRIPELLSDGVLNQLTRFVLTNAIYFKAPWKDEFSPLDTLDDGFTRLDGSSVNVRMMHRTYAPLPYAEDANFQAVELPFGDGSISMVVIVPRPGQFPEFEASFDVRRLAGIIASLDAAQLGSPLVDLGFPQFTFSTPTKLKPALEELGMPLAFDLERADFSRMSPGATPDDPIVVHSVVHQAFIAVDEKGAEAAAVTSVGGGRGAGGDPPPRVDLIVDRPFIFLIRDNPTGTLLFMGRLVDPEGTSVPSSGTRTATVQTAGDCLYLRPEPTTASAALDCFPDGTVVNLREGDRRNADGHSWQPVEVDGQQGWMAAEFLTFQ